jgi:hypothetical protein
MRAMGAANVESLQYSGSGSSFTVGQAPGPGAPWPRFELAKYVATIDYTAPAMREETVRRDVDLPATGGGAVPFIAATGQGGMRPIPGDVIQNVVEWTQRRRLVQICMTPHGFLKGAMRLTTSHQAAVRLTSPVGKSHASTGTSQRVRTWWRSVETLTRRTTSSETVPSRLSSQVTRTQWRIRFPSHILQTQAATRRSTLNVSDVQTEQRRRAR